jgi:hypothetical protein
LIILSSCFRGWQVAFQKQPSSCGPIHQKAIKLGVKLQAINKIVKIIYEGNVVPG